MELGTYVDKILLPKYRYTLNTENRLLREPSNSLTFANDDHGNANYSIPTKVPKMSNVVQEFTFHELLQGASHMPSALESITLKASSDELKYDFNISEGKNTLIGEIKAKKCATYCRRVLNIRFTANFLLAYSAMSLKCRPYLSKYFSAAVNLPSDWMKVAEVYMILTKSDMVRLPSALRNAMVEKFQEFDQYQLAKYNKPIIVKSRGVGEVKLSLKKMIRNLHISKPVDSVMCLLGKTYPLSASEFLESGLPGQWDPDMAGVRMRLPTPYTWETELSSTPKRNHVWAWQDLIHSGQLPYMAMLRNLRNLLIADIDNEHIGKVVEKLTTEKAVANSKQFPSAFMTAYQRLAMINEETEHSKSKKSGRQQSSKARKASKISFDELKRRRLMEALERAFDLSIRLNLPTISGSTLILVDSGSDENLQTIGTSSFSKDYLLAIMCMMACEDYDAYFLKERGSSEYLVAKRNKALMPGEGRVLQSVMDITVSSFQLEPQTKLVRALKIALEKWSLGNGDKALEFDWKQNRFMCGMCAVRSATFRKVLPENSIRLNLFQADTAVELDWIIKEIVINRKKYTSMVVIGGGSNIGEGFRNVITRQIGPINCVAVGYRENREGWLNIPTASESVIEVLAHLGNGSLVQQVETIDRQLDLSLKPAKGILASGVVPKNMATSEVKALSGGGGGSVMAVQVFVSSTFQDMYGERDLISGLVFPALRKKLSKLDYPVLLNEIDLRWGVPLEFSQTGDCLRVCLEKVVTSDYLILLIGERYGWSPSEEVIRNLPPKLLNEVLKIYRKGMSVTEMEARLFFEMRPQNRKNLMCFLRDPSSLNGVPRHLRDVFVQSGSHESQKLEEFKNFLKENGLIQLNAYPASFTGVVSSMPMMGDLTVLAETIFKCLYTAIGKQVHLNASVKHQLTGGSEESGAAIPVGYLEAIGASVVPRQLREVLQALLVDLPTLGAQVKLSRSASGRGLKRPYKNSSKKAAPMDGTVLCISGSYGSGKTTLVCALAVALSTSNWTPELESAGTCSMFEVSESYRKDLLVYIHLTLGAYSSTTMHSGLTLCAIPQMTQLNQLLQAWNARIVSELRHLCCEDRSAVETKLDALEEEYSRGCDLAKSIDVFGQLVEMIGIYTRNNYVFIVDSVDHLVPENLSWIPAVIPHNVRFVLTLNGTSKAARTLHLRSDCLSVTMSELSRNERAAAVRCYFAQYGKVLSESGFGNQLSRVIGKRDSNLPLYLRMACDELRLYSNFDTLDSDLKSLPDRLPDLVAHIVARASVACGENLVKTALACILCSRHAPFPAQLQRMINLWLFAACEEADPGAVAFFNTEEEEDIPVDDGSVEHPVLSTMALNVLLGQLQPLLVGFESIDGSTRGLSESDDPSVEHEIDATELNFFAANGLRLCSAEVAKVIRRLCFESASYFNRLSASRRLGYMKSDVSSKKCGENSKPPRLDWTPSELQTYRLLLCENFDSLRDKVYYAFHAKKLGIVLSSLSSISYVQQKALNNDIDGLIEEYVGFDTADPETSGAWLEMVEKEKSMLAILRDFVFKFGHGVLRKYPHLTGQLLLINLPGYCQDSMKTQLERIVGANTKLAVSPYIALSSNQLHGMEMVCRPGALMSASCVASDGVRFIACGDNNGSIILLDMSCGKVLNTLYGHSGRVNAVTFIRAENRRVSARCSLLYSVSADASACVWKLVPSGDDGKGLLGVRLARIAGEHSRGITACEWDVQRMRLFTAGLDGYVRVFTIHASLSGDADGDSSSASGLDLESFQRSSGYFSTDKQPINAMVLVKDKVVVGCWNGTVWVFDTEPAPPCKGTHQVLLVGSDYGSCKSLRRDEHYYSEYAGVRGRHVAITSLAYSGPEWDVLACADYIGEVTLVNASTLQCIIRLDRDHKLIPHHVSSRLCFIKQSETGDCLLAQTGSPESLVGSIVLWNVSQSQKEVCVFEAQLTSPPVCIAKSLSVSITIIGDDWGGIGYIMNHSKEPRHSLYVSPHKIRVQALDCAFVPNSTSFALIGWGGANGNVSFLSMSMMMSHLQGSRRSAVLGKPYHLWSHSSGENTSFAESSGGTLSLSISSEGGFGVSGGGDGVCCFYKLDCKKMGARGCDEESVEEVGRTAVHTAGVSSLTSTYNYAVSGGKDGLLVLYQFDGESQHWPVRVVDSIPQAHMDWITCLTMFKQSSERYVIVSGGNDHALGVWQIMNLPGDSFPSLSSVWFGTEHPQPLIAVSFKESLLISTSTDGTTVIWGITDSGVESKRKFILPEARQGGKLKVMNIGVCVYEEEPEEMDSEEADELGLGLLFGYEPESESRDRIVTVDEKKMDCNKYGRFTVGFMLPDGSFSLKTRHIFKPKFNVAFAGHANVLDGSTIHLCPGVENEGKSVLVSAGTSNDRVGEVCLWRLSSDGRISGGLKKQAAGAVTAITTCGKYILVGCDNGQISAYRIGDGCQVEFYGPPFARAIDDLLVDVDETGEMHGLVIIDGCAYEFDMEEDSPSMLGSSYWLNESISPSETNPFVYSVSYDRETKKLLCGTSDGNLRIGHFEVDSGTGESEVDLDKDTVASSLSVDPYPQIVTSVKKFNIGQHSTRYLGLVNGELRFFGTNGKALKNNEQLTNISSKDDLQVITYRKRDYLLVSGTVDAHYSAIHLYNDKLACLGEYKLRGGERITAFNMGFYDHEELGPDCCLLLLAGSDGILRYLKWNPENEQNGLKLIGCLPVGKVITKICRMTTSSFALGYANGDLGMYRFL
ncbi:unnamed protein product [Rodentolepis nana]|uniref:TROVE domain-containing protein n=1 Tax=Rodentolepis nana TaxID=102285 RepID=A0A0R3TLB6_RODNA|nr:unnamed protein product [Rodentolepis nana]